MKRIVSLQLVPQAKIGDYVLIRYVISVVDEEEAQETLRLLAVFTDSDEIP